MTPYAHQLLGKARTPGNTYLGSWRLVTVIEQPFCEAKDNDCVRHDDHDCIPMLQGQSKALVEAEGFVCLAVIARSS